MLLIFGAFGLVWLFLFDTHNAFRSWSDLRDPMEAWVAYRRARLPLARVRFQDSVSHVSRVVCWFSPLLQWFFSGFHPSAKINIPKLIFDHELRIGKKPLASTVILDYYYYYLRSISNHPFFNY
jgi:hypothetical protein